MSIEKTLEERGERYGEFKHHAEIAQRLQDVMRDGEGWNRLAFDQKQALTVIADKIARILNGDPNYRDNFHDIVGYAKLVDDRMARDEAEECAKPKIEFVEGEAWYECKADGVNPAPGRRVEVMGNFSRHRALWDSCQVNWNVGTPVSFWRCAE